MSLTTSQPGYYRHPTIHGETVVFVSEDDLWSVSALGGLARRLTTAKGSVSLPSLSPDGQYLAFVGREEGNSEIYVMSSEGGPAHRLTYQAQWCNTIGWTPDGQSILYASAANQHTTRLLSPCAVSLEGGEPRNLGLGFGHFLSYGPEKSGKRPSVLTRNQNDLARWKRYRGGTAGVVWIDPEGDGEYRRLLPELNTNMVRAMWIGDAIVFVSDHEGIGNLYRCDPDGQNLKRLTHHSDYYARFPHSDGKRVVYHSGADLWLLDPASDKGPTKIDVRYRSSQTWRGERFVRPARYLESATLHPKGHSVVLTVRGKPFSMGLFEGGVSRHGEEQGVRYRLARYTPKGDALIVVSDAGGEEGLERLPLEAGGEHKRFDAPGLGRILDMSLNASGTKLAIANHRYELVIFDLESGEVQFSDRSTHERIQGLSWSPDGTWVAYGYPISHQLSVIKLLDVESGESRAITPPDFQDFDPCFDPEGRYLYFRSNREFNPVYDGIQFELGFPKGMRLCAITLRDDVANPFIPKLRALGKDKDKEKSKDKGKDKEGAEGESKRLVIDLDGIENRVLAFPISEGLYGNLKATKSHVFFTSYPVYGSRIRERMPVAPPARATLKVWDLAEMEMKDVARKITSFDLGLDQKTIVYRAGNRLRVIATSMDASSDKKSKESPGRKSGWLDLNRLSVSVDPGQEWAQMFREGWRLMRDHFWTENMSGVDWDAVYTRYHPLLERLGARSEYSDLMWEMQGELGTSHAYEMGGDYLPAPAHYKGSLGANFAFHAPTNGYAITHLACGDRWDTLASSPLARAGSGVAVGDVLLSIGGRALSRERSPDQLLVNQSRAWVTLEVVDAEGNNRREVTVKTLSSDMSARYRDWVAGNRAKVREASNNRLGYIHIPDMGPNGYAEFHRSFISALNHDGVVVDVRFNGGGHVSQLLIEKLARKVVGYDVSRWGAPMGYPEEAVRGPIVAITNEFAGSDGDIFSHVFKLKKLGPLVGKRTWGGVIGIWPRHPLVDGSLTSQPEFSFWFKDVGFGVENYGTDPDVEVEYSPQDFLAGRDPQLERGIALALEALDSNPPELPKFEDRPMLAAPPLPKA